MNAYERGVTMSHIETLRSGIQVTKRDVVDDLKEVIKRYEFYQDEVQRCYHDMEEYEAKIDLLETQKANLIEALANKTWQDMRQTAFYRRQARKWRAKA